MTLPSIMLARKQSLNEKRIKNKKKKSPSTQNRIHNGTVKTLQNSIKNIFQLKFNTNSVMRQTHKLYPPTGYKRNSHSITIYSFQNSDEIISTKIQPSKFQLQHNHQKVFILHSYEDISTKSIHHSLQCIQKHSA